MPTAKKPKEKARKKLPQPVTREITLVKQGQTVLMPVPEKMLKTLKLKENTKLYWTAVDGILQLSTQFPVMVIPILDRPEEKFEAQK